MTMCISIRKSGQSAAILEQCSRVAVYDSEYYVTIPKKEWIKIRDPEEQRENVEEQREKKRGGQVGTYFHAVLFERYKVKPCKQCSAMLSEMNQRGISWCEENRKQIIERAYANRRNLKSWQRLLAALPGAKDLAMQALDSALDEAIRRAKLSQ